MIMRLYSEAIFYLNGTQQLTFFKNNELYKQCREHLLSRSAMQLLEAPSMLAGRPSVWPLRAAPTSTVGWLNHLFLHLLQPIWLQKVHVSLNFPCIHHVFLPSCLFFFFFLTVSLQLGSLLVSPKPKHFSLSLFFFFFFVHMSYKSSWARD